MYDTKKIILIWSVFLIVIAAILVCILPWASKAPQTLTAVALDSQHQEVGTFTISMDGKQKDYLFRTDRLHIDIEDFHHYQRFQAVQNANTNVYGRIYTAPSGEVFYANYSALDTQLEDYIFFTIAFSKDMTRWAFIPHHSETYYVASVDNSCTTEELVDFFQEFIPPSTDGTLDWNMEASYVTSDGTVLDTMPITLSGSIEKGQGAHDILSLYIHLPETFRFMIPTDEATQFFSPINKPDSISYYEGNAYCLDRNSANFVIVKLALSEEQKAVILYFSEDPGKFLVASMDDSVTPQQILSHFEYFVESSGTK